MKRRRIILATAVLMITVLVGLCFWYLLRDPDLLWTRIKELGLIGKVIFILFVMAQVIVAVIPGGPFETAAGFLFGSVEGTILCMIGCTAGSMLVFWLTRKFGEKFVLLFISEDKLESVSFILNSPKWDWILAVIFLIPGTPKDLLSYVAGLTKVKTWRWFFICSLGRLPAILLSALGGHAINGEKYEYAMIVLILLFLLSAIGALIYRRIKENES